MTAFSRATEMMKLITAAMASANPQLALSIIAPYKSRGKGHGRGFIKTNFMKKTGKYMPHQGKQECTRRATRGW